MENILFKPTKVITCSSYPNLRKRYKDYNFNAINNSYLHGNKKNLISTYIDMCSINGNEEIDFTDLYNKAIKYFINYLMNNDISPEKYKQSINFNNTLFYIEIIGGTIIYPETNIEKIVEHWNGGNGFYKVISYDEYIIKQIIE